MSESKYKTQIKNLRKNYVRFPLDLKPDVLEAYKAACKANGTTPTTEIKKFIAAYIAEHQATSKKNWWKRQSTWANVLGACHINFVP
ncbi:MAG: hypothetical protein V8S71_03140 [Oscillospiraceae bacterium]